MVSKIIIFKFFGVFSRSSLCGISSKVLYTSNIDTPGFIGLLVTTLGKMKVNIATFSLGRKEKAGLALALLGIDENIDPKDLEEIKCLKGVKEAKTLSFDI